MADGAGCCCLGTEIGAEKVQTGKFAGEVFLGSDEGVKTSGYAGLLSVQVR